MNQLNINASAMIRMAGYDKRSSFKEDPQDNGFDFAMDSADATGLAPDDLAALQAAFGDMDGGDSPLDAWPSL